MDSKGDSGDAEYDATLWDGPPDIDGHADVEAGKSREELKEPQFQAAEENKGEADKKPNEAEEEKIAAVEQTPEKVLRELGEDMCSPGAEEQKRKQD